MVEVAKKMIVKAYNGETEIFHGKNLVAVIEDGVLNIGEKDEVFSLGIFCRWEYVRIADSP